MTERIPDDALREWAAANLCIGREGLAGSFPASAVARELLAARERIAELEQALESHANNQRSHAPEAAQEPR